MIHNLTNICVYVVHICYTWSNFILHMYICEIMPSVTAGEGVIVSNLSFTENSMVLVILYCMTYLLTEVYGCQKT